VYAVAWNCLPKRGWKVAFDSFCDDKTELEEIPLYIDRDVADDDLLVKDACKEEENVTKPRAVVLGLAADNGAPNAELDRSIIVIADRS
jgi:hypothetical protein